MSDAKDVGQREKEDGKKEQVEKQVQEWKAHMTEVYLIIQKWWYSPEYQDKKRANLIPAEQGSSKYKSKEQSNLRKAKQDLLEEFKAFAFKYDKLFRMIVRENPDPKMLKAYYQTRLQQIEEEGDPKTSKTTFAQLNARRYLKQYLKPGVAPL